MRREEMGKDLSKRKLANSQRELASMYHSDFVENVLTFHVLRASQLRQG